MSQKKPDPLITCLINPNAANNRWVRSRKLRRTLERKLPGRYFDLRRDRKDTVQLAKEACSDSRMIVAIGGDGTIADVLQGIFESGRRNEVILGIIPFGSGNAFRKAYGIPKSPGKAVEVLTKRKVIRSDVMEVEGRYAGFASVGATARVTQEKLRHPFHGMLGHVLASWKMFKLPREEKEVEIIDGVDDRGRHFDRKTIKSRFFDCIVAKTNFFGYGWRVAPKADVQDGYLDITLVETGPAEYVLNFAWLYLGLFQRTQRHFKARKLVIRGKALPVQYNGEVLCDLDEVTFRVLPKSLRIIVNK
jgi:diacylglycerol kinase (ATP)